MLETRSEMVSLLASPRASLVEETCCVILSSLGPCCMRRMALLISRVSLVEVLRTLFVGPDYPLGACAVIVSDLLM